MTTIKDCKNSADFLNLLKEKIAPWFFCKLLYVGDHFVVMELGANQIRLEAFRGSGWALCERSGYQYTQIDRNLIRHVNGVLAGAVRDDSGRLQAPKEPESAVS